MREVEFVVGASHYEGERQLMEDLEDVAVMLRLHEKGWGSKRIARELGVSRSTVKRYLRAGGIAPILPTRCTTVRARKHTGYQYPTCQRMGFRIRGCSRSDGNSRPASAPQPCHNDSRRMLRT